MLGGCSRAFVVRFGSPNVGVSDGIFEARRVVEGGQRASVYRRRASLLLSGLAELERVGDGFYINILRDLELILKV